MLSDNIQVTIQPKKITANSGENVLLTCIINGHPISEVKWTANGKVVSSNAGIDIKSKTELQIKHFNREHEGMFQCFASNKWEKVEASSQVVLGGKSYYVFKRCKRSRSFENYLTILIAFENMLTAASEVRLRFLIFMKLTIPLITFIFRFISSRTLFLNVNF